MSTIAQFSDIRGPRGILTGSADTPEKITIVVADALTHPYDLSSSTYFNSSKYQDRVCSIIGEDVKVYYYWSDNAGDTADKSAANGNGVTVPAYLPANVRYDEVPSGKYLIMQLSAAGTVRIWISNQTK